MLISKQKGKRNSERRKTRLNATEYTEIIRNNDQVFNFTSITKHLFVECEKAILDEPQVQEEDHSYKYSADLRSKKLTMNAVRKTPSPGRQYNTILVEKQTPAFQITQQLMAPKLFMSYTRSEGETDGKGKAKRRGITTDREP